MGNNKVYRFFFFFLSLSDEKETHFTYCQEQITKPVTGKEEKENFPPNFNFRRRDSICCIQLASFLVVCVQLYMLIFPWGSFLFYFYPGQVWLN